MAFSFEALRQALRRNDAPPAAGEGGVAEAPESSPPRTGEDTPLPAFSPEVEARAVALLKETIGDEAAEKLLAGGAYPIESRLFLGVTYLVPKAGPILIVRAGQILQRSCLVVMESMPEADRLATLIRRIRSDETVVYGTGVVG